MKSTQQRQRFVRRALPLLDKKVIFLDQFAISLMVKVRMGRRDIPHADFWLRLDDEIARCLCRHTAIFPECPGHFDESLFSGLMDELERFYQGASGDVSFKGAFEIRRLQLRPFLDAFLQGGEPPALEFDVDDILEGDRNGWLGQFRVSVKMSRHPLIVEEVTRARDGAAAGVAHWAARAQVGGKFDFAKCQRSEAHAIGDALREGMAQTLALHVRILAGEDADHLQLGNELWLTFIHSREQMRGRGIPDNETLSRYIAFTKWAGLFDLPSNLIASYLVAAVQRKLAAGQKRPPSRGMWRDIEAISSYTPYVDAMLIDNECAGFLGEEPLRTDLRYRARIFSTRTKEDFLQYLRELNAGVGKEQLAEAQSRFGLTV